MKARAIPGFFIGTPDGASAPWPWNISPGSRVAIPGIMMMSAMAMSMITQYGVELLKISPSEMPGSSSCTAAFTV